MRLVETSWRRCAACAALALVYVTALAAAPLDVQVKDVRTPASAVRTTIEIRDLVPERFKRMMDDGRILHLRVQAELWESRPIWDRLVYPAIVRVFRLGNSPSGREVAITDPDGASTTYRVVPSSIPVVVDLGDRNRLTSTEKYYVHVVATLGTLADREADEVGDAVFGGEADAGGLASLGRIVVKSAMKVSDYLQSVSAETKSRKLAGAEILRRP